MRLGNKEGGRIEMEVWEDKVPKTARNFVALCTGERGRSAGSRAPLHYKGCPFHRIIPGFMAQGGDFTRRNGTGGESIYGNKFDDERAGLVLEHDEPFLLSMANSGPNTNGSQFFITFAAAPHLDGKHVVFGKVIKGFEVVRGMEAVQTDGNDRPVRPVSITSCGLLRRSSIPELRVNEILARHARPSNPADGGSAAAAAATPAPAAAGTSACSGTAADSAAAGRELAESEEQAAADVVTAAGAGGGAGLTPLLQQRLRVSACVSASVRARVIYWKNVTGSSLEGAPSSKVDLSGAPSRVTAWQH